MAYLRKAGVYDPETIGLMSRALESAWANFAPRPNDADLARLFMASAILERVDAGARSVDVLIGAATEVLRSAMSSPLLRTAFAREAVAARRRQSQLAA